MQNRDESKEVLTDCLELCVADLPIVESIECRSCFVGEAVHLRRPCSRRVTAAVSAMVALAMAIMTFTFCQDESDKAIDRMNMDSLTTKLNLIIDGIGYASVVVTDDVNLTDVIIVMTSDVNVVTDVIIGMTNDSGRLITIVGAEAAGRVWSECTRSH